MKPILGTTSGWTRCNALGLRVAVIVTLLFGLVMARADAADFTGFFDPTNWSQISGSGIYFFTNSDTELKIVGPNTPPSGGSLDGIQYNGYLNGGLVVGGTVQFDYQYLSPDDSSAYAQFGTSVGNSTNIGPGGVGGPFTGTFTSQLLPQGATFDFLLYSDTLSPDKSPASLIITDFQFHDLPEPSTGALVAGMLVCLGAARWRRARI